MDALARDLRSDTNAEVLELSPLPISKEGAIDYGQIWQRAQNLSYFSPSNHVPDRDDFAATWEAHDNGPTKDLYVLIWGPNSSVVRAYRDFIGVLNHLIFMCRGTDRKLIVVATDDTALLHYSPGTTFLPSSWSSFENVYFGPLTENQVDRLIDTGITPAKGAKRAKMIKLLMGLSGGHPGLILEGVRILSGLDVKEKREPTEDWYRESHVLQRLRDILTQDSGALVDLALKFEQWTIPSINDPQVALLKEIGVLESGSGLDARLFQGEIARLVRTLSEDRNSDRPIGGTVARDRDLVQVVDDEPTISDDDFVVVHISDLHTSAEEYRFRLSGKAKAALRMDLSKLEDLLLADLESLNVKGRVDALVVSGDLVSDGQQMAQFAQAEVLIKQLLSELGLSAERLVLVAGNHDVGWDPTNLQSPGRFAAATRDNFDLFLRLLGKENTGHLSLTSVLSRSGCSELRLLGFDSNSVESREAAGIGLIATEDLNLAALKLKNGAQSLYFANWGVCHHHLFPATSASMSDAANRKISTMANAAEVQLFALANKIEVMLHGHEHQPNITTARRWPVDQGGDFAPLISIGAGSASVCPARLGPFGRNHYYVLIRRRNDLIIRSRCLGDNGTSFGKHRDILALLPMLRRHEIQH